MRTYLDVRLADDYEAAHISGALNNAVYEVQFNSRALEQLPDKAQEIHIYGANETSLEATMAAEKLNRMGYTNVEILSGGFASWTGDIVQGEQLPELPEALNGNKDINLEASRVQWTGRNLLNKHFGTVALQSGSLNFADGQLKDGEIVFDLAQLVCSDLFGSELHDVLIAHLHNDDFLDLENHPTTTLTITSANPIAGAAAGAPNLRLNCQLTLKGQTHPLLIEATSGMTPDGKAAAQTTFSIDRTQWGINYGSGKLFHRLAGHLVNDLIDFEVKIVTA